MARFYGAVGYGVNVEVKPGVWKDVITERMYYGDVLRNSLTVQNDDKVNSDRTVSNLISLMADDDAMGNFTNIKYINWQGKNWEVGTIEVAPPRLNIRLGGVYNGPTAATA